MSDKTSEKKPLILVTNDDGIYAKGIRCLVEALRPFGEVVVVAPDSPRSAQSNALTIGELLRVRKVSVFEGIEAYECSGTPVDCVKIARRTLLKDRPIALCVSGINHGSNASINVIYSGTMSAAMEASIGGIKAIGFSALDFSSDADFSASQHIVAQLVPWALANDLGGKQLWNVNIPKIATNELKGIRFCRQAKAHWVEEYVERTDPNGRNYYWLTGKFINEDQGEDTDIWALENGYVSIVPCQFDLTDYTVKGGSFGF
jgi:5'-nucleotidase